MNIFFLSENIEECARFHNDKHVVKMILECAQLLSSVHHMTGTADESCYKLTHKNHPCAIWARTTKGNYFYLLELAQALGREYTYRYGKVHRSITERINLMPSPSGVPDGEFTYPPKCMPNEYKETSVVESYREYYCNDKAYMCTWKKREIPEWFCPA